jgi:hypothetical protein
MKYLSTTLGITFLTTFFSVSFSLAQPWQFFREKDGIRLYLRQETNKNFRSFRGETRFRGNYEKACSLVGNPANLDWWGNDIRNIRVLHFEKDKLIRYYFVYDVPWPFTDRDLVAEVKLSENSRINKKTVSARQLPGAVPLNKNFVRVDDFWQQWTIQLLENGEISVILEGYIDPAGEVPAWLYNMVIVDIPMRLLREIRHRTAG